MAPHLIITEPFGIGFGAITAPEFSQQEAEALANELASFRVSIESSALATCIDGRVGQFLGPKLAGGFKSLEVAAKATGYDVSGIELLERARSRDFNLGAHVDDTNAAANFINGTGCGANDQEAQIIQNFNENAEALEATAQTLIDLNSRFNEDVYSATTLAVTTEDKNDLRSTVGQDSVETLADDGAGVHGHTEWTVYFNYEENTTIDRDTYVAETGKKIFVVDMWYIKKLADAMAEGVDAQAQADKLYHAMVAYQLATYITLCDGSHRGVIATPA